MPVNFLTLVTAGQFIQTAFDTLKEYRRRNPLQLASSTSFFSLFALPPILIILVTILGLIIKPRMLRSEFFNKLSNTFGQASAEQMRTVAENFNKLADNWLTSVFGFIFLMFVATTLLNLIKQSINSLWSLQRRTQLKWTAYLADRFFSLLVLLIGGVLLVVTFLTDTFLIFVGERLGDIVPSINTFLLRSLHALFTVIVVTLWFTLLYKILPNARIHWTPAMVGGLVTGLLFLLGRYVLGRILVNENLGTIFGAAGSTVLVLLFIFYTSMIFYYGALFTKNFADLIGKPIKPGFYSMKVKLMELEDD